MELEIELKIPLTKQQYDELFRLVTEESSCAGLVFRNPVHLVKSDDYFSRYKTHTERAANGELPVIRIRTEKTIAQPGTCQESAEQSFFTIKRKSVVNGIECNAEEETAVANPDVLRSFFAASGFHAYFSKTKDAVSCACFNSRCGHEFVLELEDVNGHLYAEIEYTKDDCSAEEIRNGLEDTVRALGLDAEKKDSRPWIEILADGTAR